VVAGLTLALSVGLLDACHRKEGGSDAQINVDVQNRIYNDPAIRSRQIVVQAAGGVVTLSGNVNNDDERKAAQNDAAAVKGVTSVVNHLQVQ
jgi:osmotically-inducible protein OsmY